MKIPRRTFLQLAAGTATLPALPFALKNGPCLSLDLELSYDRTCRELAILGNEPGKQYD